MSDKITNLASVSPRGIAGSCQTSDKASFLTPKIQFSEFFCTQEEDIVEVNDDTPQNILVNFVTVNYSKVKYYQLIDEINRTELEELKKASPSKKFMKSSPPNVHLKKSASIIYPIRRSEIAFESSKRLKHWLEMTSPVREPGTLDITDPQLFASDRKSPRIPSMTPTIYEDLEYRDCSLPVHGILKSSNLRGFSMFKKVQFEDQEQLSNVSDRLKQPIQHQTEPTTDILQCRSPETYIRPRQSEYL